MTPNFSEMFSFAKLKENAGLKTALEAQGKIARLFADHASAQISAAGEMSRAIFDANAKLAAAAAEPARFEETGKAISTDVTAGVKAQAEKMFASTRALQAEVAAICGALAPKAA